jgi:hypothetical protein
MLVGPTLRRLESQTSKRISNILQPRARKRARLHFNEYELCRRKPTISEMVDAVGSLEVFADLTVVLQSALTERHADWNTVEMAMQNYTSAGADIVSSKIRRIYACMIVHERFEELVCSHRHRLKTRSKAIKLLRSQGRKIPSENSRGIDSRHLAFVDLVSEWQGIPVDQVKEHPNYHKQHKSVENARKIGHRCWELQQQWGQPLWALIPHRPIPTRTEAVVDAER